MTARILVIEDDPEIARVVQLQLTGEGLEAEHSADGRAGLDRALSESFDVVVLDLNLPSLGGLEVCKELRRQKPQIAIIMLTARIDEVDRILGLELGADDYVTKPFSGRELCARVKSLLRRLGSHGAEGRSSDAQGDAAQEQTVQGSAKIRAAIESDTLTFNRLMIDLGQRLVRIDGRLVELTSTEFDLLLFLAHRPGIVFTREQLLTQVWGYSGRGYERTVNTLVSRLRAKIESDPEAPYFIQTVWGVGYRFTPEGPDSDERPS